MIHALHGALGHHSDWRPIASALAMRGHSLKSVDLWRFLDCCSKSLEDTANAINQEAKTDTDPKKFLLGYSMGARLGLHALLDEPELWDGAILIAPHTGLKTAEERSLRLKADALWAAKCLDGDWQHFLTEWNAQGVLNDTPTPDRHFLKQRRRSVALSYTAWSLGMQQDLAKRLGEIPCPVLWITGSQDTKFTQLAGEAMPQLKFGQHRVIDGAGHRLPFSHPEQLAHLIDGFIRS